MKLQPDAALNIGISREHRTCPRLPAVLFAALAAVLPACGMSDTFTARANDLFAQLKLKEHGFDHGRVEAFEQKITAIKADAVSLDQLQTQIETKRNEVNPLETDYTNARAKADALQNKFENASADAERRINAIEQQQYTICSQLGGSVSGKTCMFSCPADQMGPCQAKSNSFNQQVATLRSQALSIAQGVEEEKQQADSADSEAATARQKWEEKKAELAGLEADLAGKKTVFDQKADAFEKELNSAPTKSIELKTNKALGQAVQVYLQLRSDQRPKCYDGDCNGIPVSNLDGTLAVPPASSAPFTQAQPGYQELQNKVSTLTQQYNDAVKQLKAVEADPHAEPAQLQTLVKGVSQISSQLIMQQYKLKSYNTDVTVVPPAAKQ